jgi:hypothetical protein
MIRLARYAGAARKLVADNSPAILTAVAVVGVVTTAVLAAKGGAKAHQDVLHYESEHTEPISLVDEAKLTYRYYIPALATGTATIACIIGANTISTKRSAALASAYGLTEYAFKEYREKVVQHIGEAKETKVHDEVMADAVARNPINDSQVILTGAGKALFLDNFSERYFESDMETVRRAVNDINEQIFGSDSASLNEFYNLIGIKGSKVGEEVGWTQTNKLEVRYSGALTDDGRPCVVIDFRKEPIRDYWKNG